MVGWVIVTQNVGSGIFFDNRQECRGVVVSFLENLTCCQLYRGLVSTEIKIAALIRCKD